MVLYNYNPQLIFAYATILTFATMFGIPHRKLGLVKDTFPKISVIVGRWGIGGYGWNRTTDPSVMSAVL